MLINVHSYYSLRFGTIPIDQLVDMLIEQGYDTAVLTDINNSTGVLEFIKHCQQKKFNGLAGIEFRKEDKILYIGIARNNEGFQELNSFLSDHNIDKKKLPEKAPSFTNAFVIYPFGSVTWQALKANEYIGIKPSELTKLFRQKEILQKLVMWQPVTMSDDSKDEFMLHCQLRAIDHNILLSQLQQSQAAARADFMLSAGELVTAFSAYPIIINNTVKLLEQCKFSFDFETVKNKKTYTGNRYDDMLLLEKLALDGCKQRYGLRNKEALARVKKELAIIDSLDFCAYFLITWDVIRYSTSRGFYHVGRGSGANSIVAYCLRITDVCPLELDLYFERFLNPKRKSPPDFDIDYSWKERDEVLDYVFMRYGRRHTALLGTMSTFKDRSIIREIGKVYGLPKGEIDRLIEQPWNGQNDNEVAKKVIAVYERLPKDFPNQRSIHAGGVLISELPVTAYCALDMPPKNMPTTQFDMYLAEDAGFEKLDILSQRGIGHIKEAVEIVKENQDKFIDIHAISKIKKDPQVNAQLKSGDTIGCFYIESPAMRQVLKKLHCDNYLTLVAASSIIRPGVGSSGMMDTFIQRYRNPNSFEYLHPIMKEQLEETYGVMIYQEDVLKVGHYYGGLDLADADVLRRTMSGKYRGKHHLIEIKAKFFEHCKANEYDEKITTEIWRQMESFAGYSFSKAHSASYAVESYQSLYLKAYYPIEFMNAVINNEGGFYARWVYVAEARKAGAIIHLPCVNYSELKTKLYGKDMYLGLNMVDGLESGTIDMLITTRQQLGKFTSLEDFVERTAIGLKQLLILINVGALGFTGMDKKTLLWKAHLIATRSEQKKNKPTRAQALPLGLQRPVKIPAFEQNEDEFFYDEMKLLNFSVTLSPFHMLQTNYRGDVFVKDLMANVGKKVRMVGLYVTMKPTRTKKGQAMGFGTFFDVNGEFFDTVHFPDVFFKYPFRKAGLYVILGEVTGAFDFPSITVEQMEKLPIRPDPRYDPISIVNILE